MTNAKKHILNKGISYLTFLGIVVEDANVFGEDGKSTNVSDFREGLDLLQLFNRQTFLSCKFFEK